MIFEEQHRVEVGFEVICNLLFILYCLGFWTVEYINMFESSQPSS